MIPVILAWDENLDVGNDSGTLVDDKGYQVRFRFTGKINKITLTIRPAEAHPEGREEAMQAMREKKAGE